MDQENLDDSQQHDDRQPDDAPLIQSPSGYLRIASSGKQLQRSDESPVGPTADCWEPVVLNVYDLHWINRVAKKFHLAAYHSGLEVHGEEIAYGECGVYRMTPRDVTQMESKMTFTKSVQLGCTRYSHEDVKLISSWFGQNVYTGNTYDLLRRNCNHFSAALGRLLCPEAETPRWVNSLAVKSTRLPLIERAIRHFMDSGEEEEESEEEGDGGSKSAKKKPRSGLRELSANLSRSSAAISGGKKQQLQSTNNAAEDADASCDCEN